MRSVTWKVASADSNPARSPPHLRIPRPATVRDPIGLASEEEHRYIFEVILVAMINADGILFGPYSGLRA